MKILITGTAGFIGYFVAKKLLEKGLEIIGVDNVNDYYDTKLKESRLRNLITFPGFTECRIDIHNKEKMAEIFEKYKPQKVLNLAAQAGVRYSFTNPDAYIDSNITGFLNILEGCRHNNVEHLVFASTASVYGANIKMPWSEEDSCNHQLSLYAATKKANESMAHSYSHLFNISTTCLRFFNVYGPWGRPDMALFKFTRNIIEEKSIDVYNNGNMMRSFTYVEDIADGVIKVLLGKLPEKNPKCADSIGNLSQASSNVAPFVIYNIGNSTPVPLMKYIELIEKEVGKKAIINFLPIQPGEVEKSEADNSKLQKEFGFQPKINVEEGVKNFVQWFREYYNI